MEGVTILNEFEVVTQVGGGFNDAVAGIVILLAVVICAIIGGAFGCEDGFTAVGSVMGALIGVLLGFLIGAIAGTVFASPTETSTKICYEVIVDDSVSMNEFYSKYNIVEQRGDIFVVEAK